MNIFARSDEIIAITFQNIREKNVTDGRTYGQRENSIRA